LKKAAKMIFYVWKRVENGSECQKLRKPIFPRFGYSVCRNDTQLKKLQTRLYVFSNVKKTIFKKHQKTFLGSTFWAQHSRLNINEEKTGHILRVHDNMKKQVISTMFMST